MNEDRFKFRAFIHDDEVAIHFFAISDISSRIVEVSKLDNEENKVHVCINRNSLTASSYEYRYMAIKKEYVTLMQSTGLRDKNGVLIFEGDIVVVIGEANNQGRFRHHFEKKVFVEWSDKNASFNIFYGLNGSGELEINTIEVIGNIHEHAHLLEKGND